MEDRREEKVFKGVSAWQGGEEGKGAAAETLLYDAGLEDAHGPGRDAHGTHALHACISFYPKPEFRQLLSVFQVHGIFSLVCLFPLRL